MLRSSKEGRKQAARFHAFPPNRQSRSSPHSNGSFTSSSSFGSPVDHLDDTADRIGRPPRVYSSNNTLLQRTATAAASAVAAAAILAAETESETETIASSQSSAISDPPSLENDAEEEEGRAESYMQAEGMGMHEWNPSQNEVKLSIKKVDEHEGQLNATLSPSIPSFSTITKEKTPSGETAEERSQSHSSPLSSPPTSHHDDPDEDYHVKDWNDDSNDTIYAHHDNDLMNQQSMHNDYSKLRLDGKSLDTNERRRDERQRYKRFEPRSVEGLPLSSQRSKRMVVKSQKLVESEETLAISPNSKRKLPGFQDLEVVDQHTLASSSDSGVRKSSVRGLSVRGLSVRGLSVRGFDRRGSDRRVGSSSNRWRKNSDGTEFFVKREFTRSSIPRGKESELLIKRGRGRPLGSTKLAKLLKMQQQSREESKSKSVSMENGSFVSADAPSNGKQTLDELGPLSASPSQRRSRRATMVSQPTPLYQVEQSRPSTSSTPLTDFKPTPPKREKKVNRISVRLPKRERGREDYRERVEGSIAIPSDVAESEEKSTKPHRPLWKRKVRASVSLATMEILFLTQIKQIYLSSGLYSNDYKNEEVIKRTGSSRKASQATHDALGRGTSRTRKASLVSALPLPTDYGRYLLEEKRDFRLSYSIAQEIGEIREKMEAKKKPPPYKHISQNRYVSRSKLPGEILICQCPANGDCGETCVNRQTEYLCHPKHCPCGERCTNIYFGKRKAVKTEVQWYGARGFGLKTLEAIPKGGFIDEYRGEVIDFNEAVRRIRDHYKDTGNYYFLMYDAPAGEMLDGGLKGNITRFANHSCDPNCKVQKWLVCGTDEQRSGEFQVALFAERDIQAGEELTYDYGWSAFAAKAVSGESSHSTPEECHCGAANCSGYLGVKKSSTTASSGNAVQSKVDKRLKKSKKRKSKTKLLHLGGEKKRKKRADSMSAKSPRKSNGLISLTTGSSCRSDSLPTSLLCTPTKKKASTTGLMDSVLNVSSSSPFSSLSSLSSLSDDDAVISEVEWSPPKFVGTKIRPKISIYRRGRDNESIGESPSRSNDSLYASKKRKMEATQRESSVDSDRKNGRSTSSSQQSDHQAKNQLCIESDSILAARDDGSKVQRRLTVKDRVIRVWVPIENKKQEAVVLDGKRKRRLSQKAAEQASEETQSQQKKEMARFRNRRSSTAGAELEKKGFMSASPSYDSSTHNRIFPTFDRKKDETERDPYYGLRNCKGDAFDITKYPNGVEFYNRKGESFDFVEYGKTGIYKQGKKPLVFTKEEHERYLAGLASSSRKFFISD